MDWFLKKVHADIKSKKNTWLESNISLNAKYRAENF